MDDSAPLMHVDWIRYFQDLTKAITQPLTPGMIPDIPFTKISMTLSPRLLGRTTAGAGSAEQITVSAPLTLAAGALGITGSALTRVDDTNVTLTLGGSPTTALLAATSLTLGWTGTLAVARGGTNISSYAVGDLIYASAAAVLAKRAIGATGDVLTVSGGLPVWAATSGLGTGDLTRVDDTNVTLTLGGTPVDSLFKDVSLTLGWTGTLSVSRGGTGTGTTFTLGSVIFAGASGVYSQDNANFFWDDTNNRLGLGVNSSLAATLHVKGAGATISTVSLLVEDSGGIDTFAVRDDSSTGFGKDVTLPNTTGFYYLRSGANFGNAFTITNNINGAASPMGGISLQVRYAGSQEFSRGEAISILAESINTHSGNFISCLTGSARIASAGGLATQLAGATLTARTNDATSGTVTTLIGVRVGTEVNHASVTATTAYGFQVSDLVNLGTIGNTYGVHVGDITTGTQTNTAFSFYASDANAFNYFAGRVGAGVTAPTSVLHLKAGTTAASTAPLKFTSGTSLTTAEAGALEFTTDDYFATITTGAARKGIVLDDGTRLTSGTVPVATTNGRLIDGPVLTNVIVTRGSGRSIAQVAAVASVATYTLTAADASFVVDANVNVTTSTTHNFTVAVDYTDETNAAVTLTLTFSSLAGVLLTAITNVTGAGAYDGLSAHIRCKASTAITVKTVGTFTAIVYNVEGNIRQVAA